MVRLEKDVQLRSKGCAFKSQSLQLRGGLEELGGQFVTVTGWFFLGLRLGGLGKKRVRGRVVCRSKKISCIGFLN